MDMIVRNATGDANVKIAISELINIKGAIFKISSMNPTQQRFELQPANPDQCKQWLDANTPQNVQPEEKPEPEAPAEPAPEPAPEPELKAAPEPEETPSSEGPANDKTEIIGPGNTNEVPT